MSRFERGPLDIDPRHRYSMSEIASDLQIMRGPLPPETHVFVPGKFWLSKHFCDVCNRPEKDHAPQTAEG